MALLGTVELDPGVRLTKWTVTPDEAGEKVDVSAEFYFYDGTDPVLRTANLASLLPDAPDDLNDTVLTSVNAIHADYFA
jgi:hypothetical protein